LTAQEWLESAGGKKGKKESIRRTNKRRRKGKKKVEREERELTIDAGVEETGVLGATEMVEVEPVSPLRRSGIEVVDSLPNTDCEQKEENKR
jgi:hypothetical protein